VRPLCGLDPLDELTLRSTFTLDYPRYEIIFCVARPDDPAVALARRLMAEFPHVPASLLIGEDPVSANPKLNNIVKGWQRARSDWIVLADSNVLMPPDYLSRMLMAWRDDTGLVCSPPAASHANGFWSQLEAAFFNTYQARWQYAADSVGFGFAQGKSMLWRREILDRAGGIQALGREIAEDAAATKIVRDAGLRVRLVDAPFPQPLGCKSAASVWRRQLRWARLRRASFPHYFVPELLTGIAMPMAAAVFLAIEAGVDAIVVAASLAFAWYAAEAALAVAAGWRLTLLSPLAWLARDALIPLLWLQAWLGNGFEWRGNAMSVAGGPERRELEARGNA
jgi:ceramide glucosyltransferase